MPFSLRYPQELTILAARCPINPDTEITDLGYGWAVEVQGHCQALLQGLPGSHPRVRRDQKRHIYGPGAMVRGTKQARAQKHW